MPRRKKSSKRLKRNGSARTIALPRRRSIHALRRAVELFGSENRLAAALGISQQNLNRAVRRGRVSPQLAIAIQKATGGNVTASELRPDLWRRAQDVPVEVKQPAASR
jgi:DNA-binding transcriptional regulator YdaS (Cro superfamily)